MLSPIMNQRTACSWRRWTQNQYMAMCSPAITNAAAGESALWEKIPEGLKKAFQRQWHLVILWVKQGMMNDTGWKSWARNKQGKCKNPKIIKMAGKHQVMVRYEAYGDANICLRGQGRTLEYLPSAVISHWRNTYLKLCFWQIWKPQTNNWTSWLSPFPPGYPRAALYLWIRR